MYKLLIITTTAATATTTKKDFTEPIFLIIQTKLYLKVMVKDLKIKSTEWRTKTKQKKEIINENKEEEEKKTNNNNK